MTPEEKITDIETYLDIAEALQTRREAPPPPRLEDESDTEYLIRTCDCEDCQPTPNPLHLLNFTFTQETMSAPTLWPIFLLRHGESAANADERTVDADPAQIPLTAKGIQQATLAAQLFAARPVPHLIVCSPMRRAKQTAAPLVEMFPDAVLEEWPIHELTYLSPEKCHNTTSADRKPMAEAYRQRNDPDWVEGPGAESFNQFLARVEDAATNIQTRRQKTVVMVGHNQFFTALLHRLEQGRMPTMAEFWLLADGNMKNGEVRKVKTP